MIDYYLKQSNSKVSQNAINFVENEIIKKYLSKFNLNNTKFYISDNLIKDPNDIFFY